MHTCQTRGVRPYGRTPAWMAAHNCPFASMCTQLLSARGGVAFPPLHLFNLAGLVTCFDQQNVAEATLWLFQADALGGLVASVFAPLEVWPRLSSEEGSHGDRPQRRGSRCPS